MGQAGSGERVVDLRGDRRPNAEQDPRSERGLRLGDEVVQTAEQGVADRCQDGCESAPARHDLGAACASNRSDSLAFEVLAVGEAVEVLGKLDLRADAQPVAARRVDPARQPDEEPVGEANERGTCRDLQLAEDELQPVASGPGIVDDGSEQLVLAAVDNGRDR